MTAKTVLGDVREVKLAVELISLGARLQFLEGEVDLSRERLIKLYKELKGVSPPKGLLPYSTDWYMTWMANIHSSMFYNIYLFMIEQARAPKLQALIKAYRIYMEQAGADSGEVVLDFTRACMMVKFFESEMLQLTACTRCAGAFVAHAHDHKSGYVCVLCRPPSRAGKAKAPKRAVTLGQDLTAAPFEAIELDSQPVFGAARPAERAPAFVPSAGSGRHPAPSLSNLWQQ